jgi:hypothetical protein
MGVTSRKKSLKIPKGVTRIRKSKKNRQHNDQEKLENTKGVKQNCKSQDRQYRGQKVKQ